MNAFIPPVRVIDDKTIAYGPAKGHPDKVAPIEALSVGDDLHSWGPEVVTIFGEESPRTMARVIVCAGSGSRSCYVLQSEIERLKAALMSGVSANVA